MHALRAKNVLTCQRALCAYFLTHQRTLRVYVLMCQCAFRAYVLTCASRAYVLMSKRAILNYVNSYIIQICYLYSGLKRGDIGETIVSLLEIFTSSSVPFRSFGELKMFGEKAMEKCTMYIGRIAMSRLCCPIFHFHQF